MSQKRAPVEVEVKVRLPPRSGRQETRRALERLGGTFEVALVQFDTYYERPSPLPSFASTDEALRLRVTREYGRGEAGRGGSVVPGLEPGGQPGHEPDAETCDVTYKGPKVDDVTKTRTEARLVVADAEDADLLLRSLGYRPVITVRKEREVHRVTWRGRGVEVTLDKVQHLDGEFMEVEVVCDDPAEVEAARVDVLALLSHLGHSEAASIRESYLELVLRALGE